MKAVLSLRTHPSGRRTVILIGLLTQMSMAADTAAPTTKASSFAEDLAFLRQYANVVVLKQQKGTAQLALVPAWQARVMTSTAEGSTGRSFGWVNRNLIASGKLEPHINALGGEDRLWLGPEGGQYSVFFQRGAAFDYEHWFVPPALDTLPFRTVSRQESHATFSATFLLTNYVGTRFKVGLRREVRLLETAMAWKDLKLLPAPNISLVAYESRNTLTNEGNESWRQETGLLSLWVLGMFAPSQSATIVVPIRPGPQAELGTEATSDYFGPIPPDRLRIIANAVFLRGDGLFRSKIGINPRRSLGRIGSYDAQHRTLTIVEFTQPAGNTDYVNSQWKIQQNPYAGDVANAYNDGPASPGAKPLGPFYEMESSSPAAPLAPGESLEHTHRTIHLTGPESDLDAVSRAVLGEPLAKIKEAFRGSSRGLR